MKRIGLLVAVVALLAAVPVALAAAPKAKGTPCKGAKYYGLHVHGLSCPAALRAAEDQNKGYKCKDSRKRVPFLVTCTSRKNRKVYYDYVFAGG